MLSFENKNHRLNDQTLIILFSSIIFILCGNIQLLIMVFPYIFKKSSIDKLIYILPIFSLYWIRRILK